MQYNLIQYNTMQYRALQYNTMLVWSPNQQNMWLYLQNLEEVRKGGRRGEEKKHDQRMPFISGYNIGFKMIKGLTLLNQ